MGIKNKNVDASAGIDPSKIAGGINSFFIPNNVRRVIQTSTTRFKYANKIIDMMPSGMVYTGNAGLVAAVAALDESDVLYIHAGNAVYEAGEVLNIAADRVKILGQMTSMNQWGSPSLHVHGTDTICMDIKGHQTEIAGVGFHQQTANVALRIGYTDVGGSGACWRTHVHDCYFGGNSAATYAIQAGQVGIDAPCTTVERCFFFDFVTCSIQYNAGYSATVRDCVIKCLTGSIGIEHLPNGTSRPNAFYLDNKFIASDPSGTTYGITITNTPTAGYVLIDGNHFVGFGADAYCITKRTSGYIGLNWCDAGGTNGAPIAEA